MKRKASGRDLPTSAAMAAALVVLAVLYGAALAAPLWLWSVGFLPLALRVRRGRHTRRRRSLVDSPDALFAAARHSDIQRSTDVS